MKRWIAILMIFCLALGCMTACKSKDEGKSATAGSYVEGEASTGDNAEIIENQGGGKDPSTDSSGGSTDGGSTDGGNTDGGNTDGGNTDGGSTDGGNTDGGNTDGGNTDGGNTDGGNADGGNTDGGNTDDDVEYKEGNKIKIIDYNLRCANDENGNSIQERSVRFREVMKKYTPDICGFQEVVPEWVTYLEADYPTYGKHIQYRSASSKEGTMVMWNTATMERLEEGHFWLSPTPEVESNGAAWGEGQLNRIVAWAKVKVKATGSVFVFFSTHQNNAGTHPENSAKTILAQAKKLGVGTKYGGFCMGDYNVGPWSAGHVGMMEGNIFSDINEDLEQCADTTVNGYHTGSSTNIIDFVFYTPAKVLPIHYEVVDMEIDGNYVSDHRGIYAEAALLY